jgi:hypothetical protein
MASPRDCLTEKALGLLGINAYDVVCRLSTVTGSRHVKRTSAKRFVLIHGTIGPNGSLRMFRRMFQLISPFFVFCISDQIIFPMVLT